MTFRKLLSPILGLMFAAGSTALGQTQSSTTPQPDPSVGQGRMQRMNGMRRRMIRMRARMLRESLNLTAQQLEQQKAIRQRHFAATKSLRQELFDLREKRLAGTFTPEDQQRVRALRMEMRTAMSGMHEEVLATLTPEQKAQLETLKQQRQQRRQQMMQRRQEFLRTRPGN